jgi:ABC-type bacteriocin/lantibiotic exporter with double-glycine peptidase domain
MLKVILFSVLMALAFTRTYPLFKQCDGRWGNEELGTSGTTICSKGCLLSSIAMGLSGTGHSYDPGQLNKWLKSNGGISGFQINYGKLSEIGLGYDGTCGSGDVKTKIDQGKIVCMNVHDGGHWVLGYAYNGNTIMVNDPGYSTSSYSLSEVGSSHVFTARGSASSILEKLKSLRISNLIQSK